MSERAFVLSSAITLAGLLAVLFALAEWPRLHDWLTRARTRRPS